MDAEQKTTPLAVRLSNTFSLFRNGIDNETRHIDSSTFCDCTFKIGHKVIKLHKIILAKYSNYFCKYFIEHPNSPEVIDFQSNDYPNFHDKFDDFIDMLYNEYAKIDVEDIAAFLKIATLYEFEIIKKNLVNVLRQVFKDDHFLTILKGLADFELNDQAQEFMPLITKHFWTSYTDANDKKFTIKQIYESISPKILSSILQNQDIQRHLNTIARIECIETFLKSYKKPLTEDDKKELEKVDPDLKNNFRIILKFKCSWMTDKTSLELLGKLLTRRQDSIKTFEKQIKKTKQVTYSHWYELSFIKAIALGERISPPIEVDLIRFLSTVGNLSAPINPVKYHFIEPYQCTPSIISKFKIGNAFIQDSSYYLSSARSNKTEQLYPQIGFSIGNSSSFNVGGIILNSVGNWNHLIPPPASQNRYTYAQKGIINTVHFTSEKDDTSSTINNIQLQNTKSSLQVNNRNRFIFKMAGPNSQGSPVMRVSYIDVTGSFNPSA